MYIKPLTTSAAVAVSANFVMTQAPDTTMPTTNTTEQDARLVLAVQAGNTENFVLLYDRYLDKIYRFFYFRTQHKETAEDLTSQTFIKALDKIDTFHADRGTFQAWLYRIAHNLLVDTYRSPLRTTDIDEAKHIPSSDNLELNAERALLQDTIEKVLLTLPPPTRVLVTMRIWDELSYAEIAAVLGKTEASLKMQFSRAMVTLRESAALQN